MPPSVSSPDCAKYAFRRIRYELTSWAATSLELPAALDHPLHPVVVATVAYGHFVRGDLAAAIEVGTAPPRRPTGSASLGLAERTLGNALFYLGRTDEALAWMDRMVASARTGGSPSRLAHALYMRSVAETSVGRTVRGAVLAGEATPPPSASASPTSLAQAHYALGLALEGTEPAREQTPAPRGRRASPRAPATGGSRRSRSPRSGGSRPASATSQPRSPASAPVIETWHCGGDWANLWLSLRHVFGILQQTGDHRAAAVLHGALVAAGANDAMPFEPRDAEHLADIVEQVRAQLGPKTFDQAAADGATTPEPELVAYILQRITDLMSNDQRLETRRPSGKNRRGLLPPTPERLDGARQRFRPSRRDRSDVAPSGPRGPDATSEISRSAARRADVRRRPCRASTPRWRR